MPTYVLQSLVLDITSKLCHIFKNAENNLQIVVLFAFWLGPHQLAMLLRKGLCAYFNKNNDLMMAFIITLM